MKNSILRFFMSIILIVALVSTMVIYNNKNAADNKIIASKRTTISDNVIISNEPVPLSSDFVMSSEISDILNYINNYREKKELPALLIDAELCGYADIRVKEIQTKWSHERPNGEQGYDLIPINRYAGENLAKGYTNSNDVYKAWLASPSHLENIVYVNFTKIGIAYSNG